VQYNRAQLIRDPRSGKFLGGQLSVVSARGRGGGQSMGGGGEMELELQRRRLSDRERATRQALKKVAQGRVTQREGRRAPVVGLVGYTNAGKSALLNALTGSTVASEDRLFCTLDPTMRRLQLTAELGGAKLVVVDTIGFISDIPPELVAAFRSTLDGVTRAQSRSIF
jgi:GTP-binding protein HflX